MGMVRTMIAALLLALLIVAMTALAAWAPKRYVEPSRGRPAIVSMQHLPSKMGPPIRGGG